MVYVDELFTAFSNDPQAARVGNRNRNQWCHMWADTLDELHAMAEHIGMRRAWFQNKPKFPHYDLTPGRRAAAIRAGAVPRSLREYLTSTRGT